MLRGMSKKDPKAFTEAIKSGETIGKALMAAGYSEKVARKGRDGIPQHMMQALLKEGIKLGQSITPQDQEQLIRGKLLENALMGNDKAVQSLKLLGQDKRVNMFTADSAAGVVAIQVNISNEKPEQLGSGDVKLLPK